MKVAREAMLGRTFSSPEILGMVVLLVWSGLGPVISRGFQSLQLVWALILCIYGLQPVLQFIIPNYYIGPQNYILEIGPF